MFDEGQFKCLSCGQDVPVGAEMGTKHRNHCSFCLASKHVDLEESGDRASDCKEIMEAVGLTFKKEGLDKWGKPRQGETMLVHCCQKCGEISINRIASDDDPELILALLQNKNSPELEADVERQGIRMLGEEDEKEVRRQLFGSGK